MKIEFNNNNFKIEAGPGFRAQALDSANTIIKEYGKTRRILIITVSVLFTIASLITIFAPSGREILSYILGGALVVLALGAIGVSKFSLKLPYMNIDAKDDNPK